MKRLIILAVLAFASLFLTAQAKASPYGPPCEAEEYNACYAAKILRFRSDFGVLSPERPFDLFRQACEREDADGCFGLGTMLRRDFGNDNSDASLPENVEAVTPLDRDAGLRAYEKACDLNSAMGCATYGVELLEDAGGDFEAATPITQSGFLSVLKRSCLLGWSTSCETYLDQVRLVNTDGEWPSSFASLYDEEFDVAMQLCGPDDRMACHQAAVAKFMKAFEPEGTDAEGFQGARLLVETCENGYAESCELCTRLEDTCDPETWPEN